MEHESKCRPITVALGHNIREMIRMILYLNPIDEKYYLKDDDGFVCGIGATKNEAIENAEFLGFDCNNIIEED